MKRFLTLLLLPTFLLGQNNASEQLDKYIKAFTTVHDFSGTILVVKNNKTLVKKSLGLSDIENNIPNTADTKFRIGSCSKQFTAIAILQLQEQGKLSVNDKLNKYFPDIPKSDSITLDMLLTHRSGIHDLYNDSTFRELNTPLLTKEKILEMIKSNPLDFQPGNRYHYTNSGYFLLALIIEKVSNEKFDYYINNRIFKKAKMFSSGVDHNDTILPNKAKGYENESGKYIPAHYDNMNSAMGCGNLYSTVNDIYSYFEALNNDILLTKKSRKLFLTPGEDNHTRGKTLFKGNYAYGVIIDTLAKHTLVTHGGWVYGFPSDITMCFNDEAVFVVFSNNDANVWSLSKGLQAVLFNVPVIYPYKYKEIKVDSKSLEKFVGQYGAIKIYIKDNHLRLNDTSGDDGEIKLIPETETTFYYEDENNRQISFSLDNDKVIRTWLIEDGIKHELKNKM